MEERAFLALVILAMALASVVLWPRVDQGLHWCAGHLASAPAALCGVGLAIAVAAFIFGATPIGLAGLAIAVTGGVVHRVHSEAWPARREGSDSPREGTVAS